MLPQLSGTPFLTDGGIETSLIYQDGLDLPLFAAFVLLKDEAGTEALRRYFRKYVAVANEHGTGVILESATWRANPDWAAKLGYSSEALAEANRRAIELLKEIRDEARVDRAPIVISGCLGPRDDGYNPASFMKVDEAETYHQPQVQVFRKAGADLATAITMTYPEEALGIARAAQAAGLPCVIAFTVETDGRLPNGQPLKDAIQQVDRATGNGPAYYMINCAHPTHFEQVLSNEPWAARIRGLRANASKKSHAELNEATELDSGDPQELAAHYRALTERLPHLTVLGGCCGTDERHIDAIGAVCARRKAASK
jgi:S-methylmethionine-dependent homocysteine/selenocysteine methylase